MVSGSQHIDGVIGGGQIGYNWQVGNLWVFGFETDFQGSGGKGSDSFIKTGVDICNDNCIAVVNGTLETKILWFGTARGRFGVLVSPALLLYATGGLAYGRISASGTGAENLTPASWSFGTSVTKTGLALGAGFEGTIPTFGNLTWKFEYLHIDFGTLGGTGVTPNFTSTYNWSTSVTDNIVRVGVNYRLP